MFKIEGDNNHVMVGTMQDYNAPLQTGGNGIKYTIGLTYDTNALLSEFKNFRSLIPALKEMVDEWYKFKLYIDSNPAVKASYESFLTVVALAKEEEVKGANGGSA